ncbi:MAG: hypothetical protein HYT72_00135 [Candidatus Aenigmarchaeota archaeon]|nr:hypothetical protein [Candidatus Aenigmarchaeota archaeon]
MLNGNSIEEILQKLNRRIPVHDIPIYPNKIGNSFQTIPFHVKLCKQMVSTLNSTAENSSCEIIAYLKMRTESLPRILKDKLEKSGVDIKNSHAYTLYSDPANLPLESVYIAISDSLHKSFLDLPFKIKLRKIIETNYLQIFYIESIEETFLSATQISERPLSLRYMRKGLSEFMPSFSGFGADSYIKDTLLATFIGTQPVNGIAGGIGALYPVDTEIKKDLIKLHRAIESIGIPPSHFGNISYINGDVETLLQKRKYVLSNCRNISWNLPTELSKSDINYRADFKYDAPFLSGYTARDVARNIDFRISLAEYSIRCGTVNINSEIHKLLLKTAEKELNNWLGKDPKDLVYSVINPELIPVCVYNVGSFYSKFGFDEKQLSNFIKKWVEGNAMTFGEKLANSLFLMRSKNRPYTIAEETIKKLDRRIFLLLGQTDRTEDGFIEIIASHLNYSPEKARKIVLEAWEKGVLMKREGKFYWSREKGMNL